MPFAIAAAVALSWPGLRTGQVQTAMLSSLAGGVIAALFWLAPGRTKRYVLALITAACLWFCMNLFGASDAWWTEGFRYGAERFLYVGSNMFANIPTLMMSLWKWQHVNEVALSLPEKALWLWPAEATDLTIRDVLLAIFVPLFILAGFALARHWRRGNRAFLVALVLPWVLFYTILPQMSPRYAVFIAGVGAICVGYRFYMPLLIWFFTFLCVIQTAACMTAANRYHLTSDPAENFLFNTQTQEMLAPLIPRLSWAEALAAAVIFCIAMNLRNRRKELVDNRQRSHPVTTSN